MAQPSAAHAEAATPAAGTLTWSIVAPDTAAPSRLRHLTALRASIKGREKEPSESVFKDIRILKKVPAGRLLAIMDIGYSRSLGVGCEHCHVAGKWEAEDSVRKQVARDMSKMVKEIDGTLLPKIEHLRSDTAVVNCTTCHRGAMRPALDMGDAPIRADWTSGKGRRP